MGCGQDVHLKTRTEGVIMKNDKLFVLPTQPLGSVCRDVLLKLSESAVPHCLSLPLSLAMVSAAS